MKRLLFAFTAVLLITLLVMPTACAAPSPEPQLGPTPGAIPAPMEPREEGLFVGSAGDDEAGFAPDPRQQQGDRLLETA